MFFDQTKGPSVQTFKTGFIVTIDYSQEIVLWILLYLEIYSDCLEQRFGGWRQLYGGNYYNLVIQFLQAENKHLFTLLSLYRI